MTPERWQRVRGLFDIAAEIPEPEAEEFLRAECADDPELHAEVRRMLDENARSGILDRRRSGENRAGVRNPLEPGCVIAGRYRILRPVGHGGMGEVYEAEDLELHERVALKTLLSDIAADGRMIARFKQEIQLSRKISHPNICRVFDLARHQPEGSGGDTIPFLTMEFLTGETLAARLRREGSIPAVESLALLDQMAAGLDAAHSAGVIHRDLKPGNVMLTQTPAGTRAVIMDFGLARRVAPTAESTVTMSGRLMGTLDYMAPELFAGAEATKASDIYALGLVVHKMVTGKLPYHASAHPAAAMRRAGQPVPTDLPPVDLDPNWVQALSQALDPDPARRFGSARDFIRALSGEFPQVKAVRSVITRRRVTGAVIGAALVSVMILGWHAWDQSRGRPSRAAEVLYLQGVDDLYAGAYYAATKALQEAVRLAPGYSLAHARLADAWLELDFPDKASQEMLLARRQGSAGLSRADRLQVEGIDLTITREFAAAVGKYEQMLTYSGAGDHLVDLGRAYEKAGKPDKAIESYRRAAEGPGQNPGAWLRLAILYSRSGSATKSDEAFERAERLYEFTSNLEGLTELAFQRGVTATARGHFDAAATYLQKALTTSRLAGNVQQEVRAKLQLGTNANASGNAALAETYAGEALETARANRVEPLAIRALITLGAAASRKRDYVGAEKRYEEALLLARSINSPRHCALSLISLAALHDQLAKPEAAIREAAEALNFYQPHKFAKESFQSLVILGRAHLKRDESDLALDWGRRALATAEEIRDPNLNAQAEEFLGRALSTLELYPEALLHYQKQLALSTTDEQRGYASLHYAHTLWILGRYGEAMRAFKVAEASAPKFLSLRVVLLRERAGMALSQGRPTEAANLARQALAGDTGQNESANWEPARILGLAVLASGHATEGLRQCREAVEIASKLGNSGGLLQVRLALEEAYQSTGDRIRTLQVFHEAEAGLVHRPESRWRALALASRADPQLTFPASETLKILQTTWGEKAFSQYLCRPDISKLSRPLAGSINANHKPGECR